VVEKSRITIVFSELRSGAIFRIFPRDDYAQTLRIKRFLIAFASYFIFCFLVWVSFSLGLTPVPRDVLILSQLGILASNIFVYILLRTGWNKRFKDPSLTMLQIVIATFWTMEVLYYAQNTRSIGILLYLVIFIFGLFKLNVRQFLFLSFFAIAGYAGVIALLYRNHPESIHLKMEILNMAVMAIVLPWFSLVCGYIARIKTKASDALHRIQESESRFGVIFNAASDGILLVEADNKKFSDANEKMCRMLGYPKEELLALRIPDIHPPEQASLILEQSEKLLKKEIDIAKDIPVVRKDKTLFFADISASTIILDRKEYIVELFRDVTERKRTEEMLRQSEEKYRLLADNMKDYIWLMDLDLNITYITPSAEKVMGYTLEEFKRLKPDQLLTPESFAAVMDFFAEEFPKAVADPDYVLERTIELEYLSKDGSTIWGEASFSLIRDEQGRPSSILGASRNISGRKQIENELRASEANFHRSLDESPLGVRIATVDGETLYANRAILDIYGYETLEELQTKSVQERYTPESYRQWQERKRKRKNGEFCPSQYEIGIVRKNGEVRHLQVFRKEILWNGQKQYQVIYNDITDKKRMEEQLRREEQRFRAVIEHSTDIIAVVNRDGIITYINPAVESVLGFKPEERIGRPGFELVRPDDMKYLSMSFLELIGNPDAAPIRGEMHLRHRDGSYRTLEAVGSNLVVNGVVEAVIVNYRDITERKRAEEALRKSEEKYNKLVNAIPDLVIQTDLDGTIEFVNDNTVRYSGYTREELEGQNMIQFIAPSYISKAIRNNLRMKEGGNIGPQEYELIRKDETAVPFEINGETLFNEDGTPYGFVRICRDISERKKIEETLRKSEQRYLELSILDDLTQLHNSRHFYNQLKKEVERANRYEQPLTLLLLDLDKFKDFNDTYGHLEGDTVLARLGQVIKRCLRETDSAYRYGGEEFTVLLPMTTCDEGVVTAQRIQAELKKEVFGPNHGQEVRLTLSIGVSQYRLKEDIKSFVNRADKLMYQAKKQGRNRICSE